MTAPTRYRVKPVEYDVRPYPNMPYDAPGMDEEIESLVRWTGGRSDFEGSQLVIYVGAHIARPGDYILRSPKDHTFTVARGVDFAQVFERIQGYR